VLSKRTIIGIAVGAIIATIGVVALFSSFGLQTVKVDENFAIGESTTYSFNAPAHAKQYLNITGNSFDVNLETPYGGLQIPRDNFKDDLSLEWVHLIDGQSILEIQNTGDSELLEIQNTGDSELRVYGTIETLTDPIMFSYHILVIVTGLVIIGLSSAFSVRKPRGF
jgi:hypothetical protein